MSKNTKYDIPNDALVILVGTPRSGKLELAKKIAGNEDDIISSSQIRKNMVGNEVDQAHNSDVFVEFCRRIEEKVKKGKLAIADATSIFYASRKKLYTLAQKYNRPIRVVIMNVTLEEILEQNLKRTRMIPEETLINMYEQLGERYRKIQNEVKKIPNAKVCDVFWRERIIRYRDEKESCVNLDEKTFE